MKNKVFFNNSCNICRAEINHYKKHSDGSVEWIDVTDNEDARKITGLSNSFLNKLPIFVPYSIVNNFAKKYHTDMVDPSL